MEKKPRVQLFDNLPLTIESTIKTSHANHIIDIYSGEFELRHNGNVYKVKGEFKHKWFPHNKVVFEGFTEDNLNIIRPQKINYELYIQNNLIGYCNLDNIDTNLGEKSKFIEGNCSEFKLGDTSISVEKIIFSVPNFLGFSGSNTRKIINKKNKGLRNRFVLEDVDYVITLDNAHDIKDQFDSLQRNGGYAITCYGEIKKKTSNISHTDIQDIIECLNIFLSFIGGRRTSILFIEGIKNDEQIWCDYSSYYVEDYKSVSTWAYRFSTNGINGLWIDFCKLWKKDKDFILTAIHWYNQSNSNAGLVEGSIILAQTNLELIFNWWIVEELKIVSEKDSSKPASAKIRDILAQVSQPSIVPKLYSDLEAFVSTLTTNDAPEGITQIRNALVHANVKKRKKLDSIPLQARWEALNVLIWYTELAILKILNYDQKYINRTQHVWETDFVPWIPSTPSSKEIIFNEEAYKESIEKIMSIPWPDELLEDDSSAYENKNK